MRTAVRYSVILGLLTGLASSVQSADKKIEGETTDGERAAWEALVSPKMLKNPAFSFVKDDPNLPRVLLIGDSISIGYTAPTRKELEGEANVHRIPENGGHTKSGLDISL